MFRRRSSVFKKTKGKPVGRASLPGAYRSEAPLTAPSSQVWRVWTTDEVVRFARCSVTGFQEKHAVVLKDQEVLGEDLPFVSTVTLERWGLPGGVALRLWRAVVRLTCPQLAAKLGVEVSMSHSVGQEVLERCLGPVLEGTQAAVVAMAEAMIADAGRTKPEPSRPMSSGPGSPTSTMTSVSTSPRVREGRAPDAQGGNNTLGLDAPAPPVGHAPTAPFQPFHATASPAKPSAPRMAPATPTPAANITAPRHGMHDSDSSCDSPMGEASGLLDAAPVVASGRGAGSGIGNAFRRLSLRSGGRYHSPSSAQRLQVADADTATPPLLSSSPEM